MRGKKERPKKTGNCLFCAKPIERDILNSAVPLAPPPPPPPPPPLLASPPHTPQRREQQTKQSPPPPPRSSPGLSPHSLTPPYHHCYFKCRRHLSARARPAPDFLSRCGGALLEPSPYSFSNGSLDAEVEFWVGGERQDRSPGAVRGSGGSVPAAHGPPPRLQGVCRRSAGGPCFFSFLVRAFNASVPVDISRSIHRRIQLEFATETGEQIERSVGVEPASQTRILIRIRLLLHPATATDRGRKEGYTLEGCCRCQFLANLYKFEGW